MNELSSGHMFSGSSTLGNVIAGLASFFLPGSGQLLQGRRSTAKTHFVLAVLLWFLCLGWIIHLISMADAGAYPGPEPEPEPPFDPFNE